jgi:hypothetical protein
MEKGDMNIIRYRVGYGKRSVSPFFLILLFVDTVTCYHSYSPPQGIKELQ